MKIVIEKSKPVKIIKVKKAQYLKDFVLRISFDDGTEQAVDFKPFLLKANHPDLAKYKNEGVFKKFKIKDGNLNWNDFDLIFPISDLYNGRIN